MKHMGTKLQTLVSALPLLAIVPLVFSLQTAAGGGPTRVESPDTVTLSVRRFYDKTTELHHFHFQGRLSSPSAGEYVAVMHRKCGQSFATAVAGATSEAGGIWGASPTVSLVAGSGTFQARWKNDLSPLVTLRPPIDVRAEPRRDGTIRVVVTTYEVLQDLRGRTVVLQRLNRGTWSNLQRARLKKDPRSSYWSSFVATFTFRDRGVALRAAVPAKTAGPCFKAGATTKWSS
jgi:hypothetical protein